MKKIFNLTSFIVIQFFLFTSNAYAQNFWTGKHTLQITRLETYHLSFNPIQFGHSLPAGAKIERVEASMFGDQIDRVSSITHVCWNGISECVPMYGKEFTTYNFRNRDASKPIYVVLRATSFGGLYPAVYVPITVTVYYKL
ncbi:hypothetical protein [Alcaligenes sp. SMD-FA]|uniref:hypothetical protein n=1 Tax=Alcaligenes sp. SMD-FA TaxID=2991054 RepID=UPI0022268E28|nr:hypothetical protein [Alcaligenes sp. SMD-FA]UYY87739.1 hypothetical protein OKX01_02180 [Alcaligenes sp. SMD-FA]